MMHLPSTPTWSLILLAVACARSDPSGAGAGRPATLTQPTARPDAAASDGVERPPHGREVATLAGGCFWGMEELLRALPGVIDTRVGYTGGRVPDATYEVVSGGRSGHAESVEIVFDPSVLSYEALLLEFFKLHDPTTPNRQGNDVGSQYRSAIFVHGAEQRATAERVRARVAASGEWSGPITTEIVEAGPFYTAEDYHQDYLQRHPGGYTCHYRRDLSF